MCTAPNNALVFYPPIRRAVQEHVVPFNKLIAHVLVHPDEMEALGIHAGNNPEENVLTLVREQNDVFHAFLGAHGLMVAEAARQVIYFREGWPVIKAEIAQLRSEHPESGPATDRWLIGGSDDTYEYHTGYVECFLGLLSHYHASCFEP